MTHTCVEDVPSDVQRDLVEGIVLVGRKLREWRDFGSFDELRATIATADGSIILICHHDDRVMFVDGDVTVDLTAHLDAGS